ncbi:HAD family hydrolase [Pontibacter qinzhouensis]|uniref:phosphoglycolate phosphatase n=1 Tax=Pontibacter qinzhouensis TaxID=2603253 RepID=A0A5C8JME2_9BACT|nr:HAD family hydrolase [Pontibacter qinzhouensis]TXK37877.1 HAD family hydrolase [Pontibacter qinzhouensis]
MLKNTDSIIFDLDGTLWDATATVAKAWQAAIDKVDYVQDEITVQKVQSITGMTYDAIYDKLYAYLSTEQRNELKAICAKEELEHMNKQGGNLYEGLEKTLRALKERYRLFIVSNCQMGYIESFLEHSKLHDLIEGHQCYGTKSLQKSENIKEIVARHQLANPVYVGDTLGDYEASKKAGVPFIYASYGFGDVPGYDARIDSIPDLEKLFLS